MTTGEAADRARFVAGIRRRNERLQDALLATTDYDAHWGAIEAAHRDFVGRFLAALPPHGRVLDAACGTGKYFGMVLAAGRSVLGIDHSAAMLARAREKFPDVPTEKRDLQDLAYRGEFDGVLCVDAMESLPPEDWPVVLNRLHAALRAGGWLYLTVELAAADAERVVDEDARAAGVPLEPGETAESDGYYHFLPAVERVRAWLAEAGFAVVAEAQDAWDEGGCAYRHVLARRAAPAG